MRPHCAHQPKYTLPCLPGSIPEAPEIWIPPYYGHTAVVPTVSALEEIHCIWLYHRLHSAGQKINVLLLSLSSVGAKNTMLSLCFKESLVLSKALWTLQSIQSQHYVVFCFSKNLEDFLQHMHRVILMFCQKPKQMMQTCNDQKQCI